MTLIIPPQGPSHINTLYWIILVKDINRKCAVKKEECIFNGCYGGGGGIWYLCSAKNNPNLIKKQQKQTEKQ